MTATATVTTVVIAVGFAMAAPTVPKMEAPPAGCLPSEPISGIGVVDPFHLPVAPATQLNADGKILYRQERWDQARAKYRAAEAADPDFLAPILNVACSFVRQERFTEAMLEVRRLLDRAYLPWSAEVLSAADLGALKVRGEGKELRAVLEAGRQRWADGLSGDVVLVARLRPPLKLGDPSTTTGALVLGPRQEILAWSPRTLRYRQVTSEEGRVIAVARSSDGRKIAYVTAEKLIRAPGAAVSLRGIFLTELELGTLAVLGRVPVEGDVRRLDVLTIGTGFAYRIDRGSPATTFRLADGRLEASIVPRAAHGAVTLTGTGVLPNSSPRALPGGCGGAVRDVEGAHGMREVRVQVQVKPRGRGGAVEIGGPFGSSLSGLPIP